MEERKVIISDKLAPVRERHGYSHAIKAGNTIYLSGQVAEDDDGRVCHKRNFLGQLEMVLENIKNVLEAAGSNMQDVVKMTVFCRHLWDLKRHDATLPALLRRASTGDDCVEIVQLWNPHLLVEIEAVAVIGEKQIVIGN